MEIQIKLKNHDQTNYDISDLVTNVEWTTYLKDQPGRLSFEFINQDGIVIDYGAPIEFIKDGEYVFKGYVFIREYSKDKYEKVTCYDQLRYLQNRATATFKQGMTASQIFEYLCTRFLNGRSFSTVKASTYKLPHMVQDNMSIYEMISDAILETVKGTKELFIVRDNFGTLEFNSILNLDSKVVFEEDSLLENFDYKGSIDEKTYSKVLTYIDEHERGKEKNRIYGEAVNSTNLGNYGLLLYSKRFSGNLNKAQLNQKAQDILDLYSTPTYTLSLSAIGNVNVFAGSTIYLRLNSIDSLSSDGERFIVESCTHTFKNEEHKMRMSVCLEEGITK